MILSGIFGAVICAAILSYTSYLDIKHREITKHAQITAAAVILIGIVTQILHTINTGEYIYLIYTAAAVLISIGIYTLNIALLKHNKPRVFGGADTLMYLSICSMCPAAFGIPTALWLLPAAFLLALFADFIPRIHEAHKRSIPFIVYIFAAWFIILFIPWLIFGV